MKRKLFWLILELAGAIGILVCSIVCVVLQIKNPDMTEFRMMLEYPWVTIGCFISAGAFFAGKYMG